MSWYVYYRPDWGGIIPAETQARLSEMGAQQLAMEEYLRRALQELMDAWAACYAGLPFLHGMVRAAHGEES